MKSCFCVFEIVLLKTHKKETRRPIQSYQLYAQLTMTTSNFIVSYQASLNPQQKLSDRGNNIVVGMVLKAKICELKEEVSTGSLRRTRKELTGVVQGVSSNKRFFVRFLDGCKNNMFESTYHRDSRKDPGGEGT